MKHAPKLGLPTAHRRIEMPDAAFASPPTTRSRFLQGPETDKRAVQEIRRAIDNASECTVRLLNYTKTGQPFWCESACFAIALSPLLTDVRRTIARNRNMFTLAPLLGLDGKPRFFIGVQVDVTAREEVPDEKLAAGSKLAANGVIAGFTNSAQVRVLRESLQVTCSLDDAFAPHVCSAPAGAGPLGRPARLQLCAQAAPAERPQMARDKRCAGEDDAQAGGQ